MTKLTIYLDKAIASALRRVAADRQSTQSQTVRAALANYFKRPGRPPVKGMGAYNSGRSDVSERAEELLREAARVKFRLPIKPPNNPGGAISRTRRPKTSRPNARMGSIQ